MVLRNADLPQLKRTALRLRREGDPSRRFFLPKVPFPIYFEPKPALCGIPHTVYLEVLELIFAHRNNKIYSMSPTQAKNLESRINRLEKLVDVVLRQDDADWLNDPKLVAKLDKLAGGKTLISEVSAGI